MIMAGTTGTFWVWLPARRLESSWHPSVFAPQFLGLDETLESSDRDFIPLANFVEAISERARDLSSLRWRAAVRSGRTVIQERAAFPAGTQEGVLLPSEAIAVAKQWVGADGIRYWHHELFPGGGTAREGVWVLKGRDSDTIAWLQRELTTRLSLLQLQRLVVGSALGHIPLEGLMDIRIRRIPVEQRIELSREVKEETRRHSAEQRHKTLQESYGHDIKPFLLTARTFEERLTQFEEFIRVEGLFSSSSAFFVEASTQDPSADLFIVRPLRGSRLSNEDAPRKVILEPQDDLAINAKWRDWYWSTEHAEMCGVFNSLVSDLELPPHLLIRMANPQSRFLNSLPQSHCLLPAFSTFRNTIEAHGRDDHWDLDEVGHQIAADWTRLHSDEKRQPVLRRLAKTYALGRSDSFQVLAHHPGFTGDLLSWLRSIYRPALALKVIRDETVAGVYILLGDDQLEDASAAYARLEAYGLRLAEILSPPSDLVDEATRRESLRRLSWVMHQFNGPIGRAVTALEDLQEFCEANPTIADRLIPNEEIAQRQARSTGESVDSFSVANTISHALKNVNDIRRLTYQIRRLRRAQGDLPRTRFSLARLVGRCVREACTRGPALVPTFQIDESCEVTANEETVADAIAEVLNNSFRELREQRVEQPSITTRVWMETGDVHFTIEDNALPVDQQLIRDPFKEDASTYARSGRGSGLGLAIVYETFRAHGGSCDLTGNRDAMGNRLPGVTFKGSLPLPGQLPNEELKDG
jgi:signal transduction histidine kinase